jgi:N-acetylmuramoyl-L-alanine amidase
MRKINFIVVHCTATPSNQSIESIKKYWRESLGWTQVGYHWMIKEGGNRVQLIPEGMISNGVKGRNHECINISYIGGIINKNSPYDTRTEQQKISMLILLQELKDRYPNALILGHRDFQEVNKACPCFNAIDEFKHL